MAITDNDALANALLDHIGDQFSGGTLQIRTGAPAGPNGAAGGTLLAEMTLPSPAYNSAASRSKTKTGTWSDPAANAAGDAGHFRITNAGGTRVQEGTVSASGGGGDMIITVPGGGVTVAVNDIITINSCTLTH